MSTLTAAGVPAAHDPPVRVMALHALLYCKRLFYLEEVEEIRVADAAVYAGREVHASLEAGEGEEWCSLELQSAHLGLMGKLDCLRRRDGVLIPYEHKRGRCMRVEGPKEESDAATRRRGDTETQEQKDGENGSRRRRKGKSGSGVPGVWPSDRVQAIAYAMLLADATGQAVPEARVHYHADNVTVRVPIDAEAEQAVLDALAEARRLRNSLERPPIADNEKLCARCSLAPVCLPEEVRHDQDARHEPVRLFPPDDDRATLHVVKPGAVVGRSGDMLVVRPPPGDPEAKETRYPSREVRSVLLHGFAQITTQAVRLCVDREIGIHWLTAGGVYLAGMAAGPGGVQRRLRQYKALTNPMERLRLAKALVHAKVQGQHRYLLRATREQAEARARIEPALRAIGQTLAAVERAANVDVLRGYEGEAAVHYFGSLDALLSPSVPPELRYDGRNRRPPRDRFNALLSFGYGLLYSAVMRSVMAVGLEPAMGFFHQPRSAAHPLVLDLMELFRVPLWDLVVIGSLNRGQWDPDRDFTVTGAKVWLSEEGRRKAIGLFEGRLEEQWKHPVLNYSLSYCRTMELEVRLLEKEWTGEPGLFARARLR